MTFSQRQAGARHDLVEFTFVNTLHVFVVHSPVAGLGKKVLDVARAHRRRSRSPTEPFGGRSPQASGRHRRR